jgi:hypothetical protein
LRNSVFDLSSQLNRILTAVAIFGRFGAMLARIETLGQRRGNAFGRELRMDDSRSRD